MIQNLQIKILDLDAKDVNRGQRRRTSPEEGGKRFQIPCNECCLPSPTPLGLFPTDVLVSSALVAILLSTTDCLSFTFETYSQRVRYISIKNNSNMTLFENNCYVI